jgi:DNA-binding NarL/FixJ family response regulator
MILLAEDHAMVRLWVRKLIETNPQWRVVKEVGDGVELLQYLQGCQNSPNLLVLDLSMPRMGGLEVLPQIKSAFPDMKILVLTMHKSKEYFERAMAAGANGYLLKQYADTALHTAISVIRQGGTYISPGLKE